MARFQKLTRNLFLTLHGHNVHRQQRQLSKFLMRYKNSSIIMLTAGKRGQFPRWRRSRKTLSVCCDESWLPCGCVSCDQGCTHWRIVINAWETWTVGAADGVCCARVRWEMNFLLTFETAPFFCVFPVCDDLSAALQGLQDKINVVHTSRLWNQSSLHRHNRLRSKVKLKLLLHSFVVQSV